MRRRELTRSQRMDKYTKDRRARLMKEIERAVRAAVIENIQQCDN